MHELAVMQGVIDTVIDHVGDARVALVRLEIGQLSGVAPDALRFCFEVAAHDTTLAGAELDIIEIAARARCRACNVEGAVVPPMSPCVCGSFDRELVAGAEMRVKEVEVI